MEQYLNNDIVGYILNYLNKVDSFNFLNTSTLLSSNKKLLYAKYLFNHHKIENNGICSHIKHIIIKEMDNINIYANLCSLQIIDNDFDHPLDFLPKSLTKLIINSTHFNQPIDNLPCENLQTLKIIAHSRNQKKGTTFDQSMTKLPKLLRKLTIDSGIFNHPLDSLPKTLYKLKIISCLFNYPLDLLPNSLNKLTIRGVLFDQPINQLPDKLKTLNIFSIKFNHSLDKLPKSLYSLQMHLSTYMHRFECFPKNLHKLKIISYNRNPHISNLPGSLQSLTIKCYDLMIPIRLPPNLNSLTFKINAKPDPELKLIINNDNLPINLKMVTVNNNTIDIQ